MIIFLLLLLLSLLHTPGSRSDSIETVAPHKRSTMILRFFGRTLRMRRCLGHGSVMVCLRIGYTWLHRNPLKSIETMIFLIHPHSDGHFRGLNFQAHHRPDMTRLLVHVPIPIKSLLVVYSCTFPFLPALGSTQFQTGVRVRMGRRERAQVLPIAVKVVV